VAFYTRAITVDGPVTAGQLLVASIDTRVLVTGGKCRPDRRDLRLYYSGIEIARDLPHTDEIRFKAQVSVASGATDTYELRYGSGVATDPLESAPAVYAAAYDGLSLASLSTTGTVATAAVKRLRFRKHGTTPVIPRSPGSGDYANIREVATLLHENGWWYVWYDANDYGDYDGIGGWTVYQRKSQDLKTWAHLGQKLTVGGGPAGSTDTGTASSPYIVKFGSTYYMNYLGSPNLSAESGDAAANVPNFNYQAHLATATNIEGPWTKQGKTLALTAPHATTCNVFGSVVFDGTTYHAFYSGSDSSAAPLRGIGRATAPSPSGPWTDRGLVIPNTEQVENAIVLFVDGVWYMIVNHIGIQSGLEFTVSNIMYWSDSLTSWNVANKTSVITPTYQGWDGKTIGCPGIPVIENGVCYITYDGTSTQKHNGRDGQVAEALWPPVATSALSLATGATVTTPVSVGDARVRVRFRPTGSDVVRVGLGSAASTRVGFTIAAGADILSTDNNGTVASTGYGRVRNQVKTYEIRRSGTSAVLIFDGVQVGSVTGPAGSLPVFVQGAGVIESIEIEQASQKAAAVGSEELGLEALEYDLLASPLQEPPISTLNYNLFGSPAVEVPASDLSYNLMVAPIVGPPYVLTPPAEISAEVTGSASGVRDCATIMTAERWTASVEAYWP
jgi:hypothetical protein